MLFQKLLVEGWEEGEEKKKFSIYASVKIDVVVHFSLSLPRNDMTDKTICFVF